MEWLKSRKLNQKINAPKIVVEEILICDISNYYQQSTISNLAQST